MKAIKYLLSITLMIYMIAGCKREEFTDTSFANTAATAGNLSVMFSITQDNTGLVTITPNGEGAISYDVYFGDAT
ncbi:MAG: PKD domain protein, partial [Bacteroidetes bacterium]|nr:PKD domain protein [Bacteroidota bacterium]